MICNEEYIAINVESDRIFNIRYRIPKNPQDFNWRCKDCGKPVFYNDYYGCFKHHGQKPEGFEPETIEHKTMKNYWYNIFPKFNDIKSRTLEYWFEDQVADVYFELQDGKKVAIECQNSPITTQNLIKRTKKYTSKDIYVLWIFNGLGSCISEKKYPRNMDKVSVLKEEKRAHNLYSGRNYYMNVEKDIVDEDPYPLHFSPYFENKKLENNIFGHDKYYRKFQSATVGKIFTYKILCIDYKGYKLARFMDKNVSISCTEQLIDYIREICHEKVRKGDTNDKNEFKVTVNSIINMIKEEFGYFLPYLILKRSKRIKNVSFGKLIDEEYKIQETLTFKTTDFENCGGNTSFLGSYKIK
ncbi:hypothetical protein LCGC14_2432590 [marine sediment metagenome]|uniref:Competence protein CoiA nuclease-like domain-containing protein n=1 Tax=marine sediment metagenome TaxID=412755 RepID=A0A0F9BLK6_9ZZZZ